MDWSEKQRRLYESYSSLLQLNIEMGNIIWHNLASIIYWITHNSNLKNKFKIVEVVGKDILVYKIKKPHLL